MVPVHITDEVLFFSHYFLRMPCILLQINQIIRFSPVYVLPSPF